MTGYCGDLIVRLNNQPLWLVFLLETHGRSFWLSNPIWFEISLLFFLFFGELNVSLPRDLVSHWQGLHALGATWRILLPTNFFIHIYLLHRAIRTYSDTKSVTDKLGQYNRANHSQSTNEPQLLINKTLFFQWINAYCVDLNTTPTQNESADEYYWGGSSLQFQWFVKWCKLTHKTSCQLYYIWHYHRFYFHLQGKSKNRAIRAYCGDNKDVFSQCVGLVCAAAAAILFNGHITWAMLGMSQFVGERTIWRRTSSSSKVVWESMQSAFYEGVACGVLLSAIAFLIDRRGRGSNYFKSNYNLSRGKTI